MVAQDRNWFLHLLTGRWLLTHVSCHGALQGPNPEEAKLSLSTLPVGLGLICFPRTVLNKRACYMVAIIKSAQLRQLLLSCLQPKQSQGWFQCTCYVPRVSCAHPTSLPLTVPHCNCLIMSVTVLDYDILHTTLYCCRGFLKIYLFN
jgi:hypothetical protein